MVAEHWLLLRLNWAMASFGDTGIGGSARLPLPDKFDGKMENWEDWSWQVKAYVSLFKVEALRVLEDAETARSPITDDILERLEVDTTELVDTELVKFSRQLHYLLTQITSGSARLVVRGNTELNGFESWRLLARRFSLPGTALDISLLTRVLEFKFRPDHFEQDYSEWETLKARYERQSGSALPDSILVATLLSKTTGALQQHLRLNVRSLDTYETVRNVITAYYQSRHVTGFRSLSDTGPTPMDIGAMWQRKGKGRGKWSPLGKGLKGKGKGKGKGRLPSFGQLKGKSKGKGKWFPTGKGKSGGKTHTGKGKDRVRCWKCGQHGHFEKDCKNVAAVTEESEELYDENDWTNDGTEYYVMVLIMTGHSRTGMMVLTGMTMVGMTTGPGVVEVTLLDLQHCPNLSNQLHPAALPRTQLVSLVRNPGLHHHQMFQHFTQLWMWLTWRLEKHWLTHLADVLVQ